MTVQRDELSIRDRAVLFALLAEARQLTNPELEERIGFRLDGRKRRRLNELRLVESEKAGRAFAHELSDAGWRWCADALSAAPAGRGSGSSLERAQFLVLGVFGRRASAAGLSLADVFRPGPGRPAQGKHCAPDERDLGNASPAVIEARIKSGYRSLADGPADFVRLSELRPLLAGALRADVDAMLVAMYAARRVNLIPQSNQQALTVADRAAALRIGGEDKHLISIGH